MKHGQLPFNVDASTRAVAWGLGQLPKANLSYKCLHLGLRSGELPSAISGMAWHVAEFEKKSKRVARPA